jgi:hypothetical protein
MTNPLTLHWTLEPMDIPATQILDVRGFGVAITSGPHHRELAVHITELHNTAIVPQPDQPITPEDIAALAGGF